MKNKIPTVTVAVSAYNEEKNILNFLNSVIKQEEKGFKLDQIWVHSDGSTDNTANLVKGIRNKKIKLFDHKKRVGKSTWLNQIYRELESDFLVQSDADVIFADSKVISHLIQPLIRDKRVGIVGGNPMPLQGFSFWEKVVINAFEPYLYFRAKVRGGNNAFSAIGQLLSYRKEFVKQITIPADMVTNDIFTYFYALKLGWKYKYAKKAVVNFKAPDKLSDFIKQNTRFQVGHQRMYDYYSKDTVDYEMSIPFLEKGRVLIKQFFKYPILSLTFYIFKIYCVIKARKEKTLLTAKWPIAVTTKKLA